MTTRRKMCQIKGISEAKMEKIKVGALVVKQIFQLARLLTQSSIIAIKSLVYFFFLGGSWEIECKYLLEWCLTLSVHVLTVFGISLSGMHPEQFCRVGGGQASCPACVGVHHQMSWLLECIFNQKRDCKVLPKFSHPHIQICTPSSPWTRLGGCKEVAP